MADDIFKKKSDDIFAPSNDDIFKKSDDVLAKKARYNADIFKNRNDIFQSPGFTVNIFPEEGEKPEKIVTADILDRGKYRKRMCHAKTVSRTLGLYLNNDNSDEPKTKTEKPKQVTIKEDWD